VSVAARVSLYDREIRSRFHRCSCTSGTCGNASESPAGNVLLDRCPFELPRSPLFQACAWLSSCMDVAPVSGWPDSFAGAIVDGVRAIRVERGKWEADMMKRARKQG